MKIRRLISALIVAGLFAGAVPAAAHTKSDAGVFQGVATVGKEGSCNQNGQPTPGQEVRGAGIGFPFVTDLKKAWWSLDTALTTVQHPLGLRLFACGRLSPVNLTPKRVNGVSKVAVGASCGMSHGHDGWGEVRLAGNPHYRLRNLGWPTSAGGFLPVNGDIWVPHNDGKMGKKTLGPVVALVVARGIGCETKPAGPKAPNQGARDFAVAGVFAAYKFKGSVDPNDKKGQDDSQDTLPGT